MRNCRILCTTKTCAPLAKSLFLPPPKLSARRADRHQPRGHQRAAAGVQLRGHRHRHRRRGHRHLRRRRRLRWLGRRRRRRQRRSRLFRCWCSSYRLISYVRRGEEGRQNTPQPVYLGPGGTVSWPWSTRGIQRMSAVHGQGCCSPCTLLVPRSIVHVEVACCQGVSSFQGLLNSSAASIFAMFTRQAPRVQGRFFRISSFSIQGSLP